MNGTARPVALALVVLAAAAWSVPGALVRAAYEERLTPRIDGILSGRDVHPVEHYLELVATPRAVLAVGLLAVALLLLVLERPGPRSRLLRVLTGGRAGSSALWRPAALLIVVTAAALRFPALGATSLWLDEAMVAGVSLSGIDGLFQRMGRNSSAGPLHHLVQMGLLNALGQEAWVARLPSAVAGLTTVVLMLGLHRLGLPRSVALVAASVVAVSPAHVGFSRDATQYAPVVLMAAVVLAAGLAMVDPGRRDRIGWRLALVGALALAPWSGAQITLVALAVVVALATILLTRSAAPTRATLGVTGPGVLVLAGSTALAYVAVVRRQTRVLDQWYLAEGYPASSARTFTRWALEALDGFMAVVAGGQVTGRWTASGIEGLRQPLTEGSALGWLLLVVLAVGCVGPARRVAAGFRRRDDRSDPVLDVGDFALLAAAALILGSILAAVLGVYPFGGMHQQLHATPVVLVGSVVAFHRVLVRAPRRAVVPAALAGTALLLLTAVPAVPAVYAEREDIVSAVGVGVDGRTGRGLDALEDGSVWVYRDARPAVRFHFPERTFVLSRAGSTDPAGMRDEVVLVADGRAAALVFSQIHADPVHGDQRRALQALLLAEGWTVLEEIHHPNTVVLTVLPPASGGGVVDTPEPS